jgi:UDP-N-acetylmuramoylalanine--D-glutamate ligase
VIARPPLPPGPFVVVGLARSGVAAALALRERGAEVMATDARAVDDEVRARLAAAGVAVRDGEDGVRALDGARTVVKSPGVPQDAAAVAGARARALEVIGEVELGWRLLPNEFLGVTGSNGKTTTVELLGHVHRCAGVPVVVAGNVGTPLVSLADTLAPETLVVCELSSFQLEDTVAFAPETAVLLNLTEDHLDRHGTFAAYRAAKLQIFARQPAGARAVVPARLPLADAGGAATRVTFGDPPADLAYVATAAPVAAGGEAAVAAGGEAADAAQAAVAAGGELRWRGEVVMRAEEVRLPGAHNRENAMAAAAACLARGVPVEAVREGLAMFAGVPHRLETVATVAGVRYVNDSKATNVASAEVGLAAFPGGVHLIAGGSRKGSDYRPLAAPVARRCSAVYLIGETAPELREALSTAGVPLHDCGDLERAVAAARAAARPGEVVLLSPACASYDQYRSYEERGDHFRALVAALG